MNAEEELEIKLGDDDDDDDAADDNNNDNNHNYINTSVLAQSDSAHRRLDEKGHTGRHHGTLGNISATKIRFI